MVGAALHSQNRAQAPNTTQIASISVKVEVCVDRTRHLVPVTPPSKRATMLATHSRALTARPGRAASTKLVPARRFGLLVRCQASTPAAVVDQVELGKSGECIHSTHTTHQSLCLCWLNAHTHSPKTLLALPSFDLKGLIVPVMGVGAWCGDGGRCRRAARRQRGKRGGGARRATV